MPEAKLMGDILNKNTLICNTKESLVAVAKVEMAESFSFRLDMIVTPTKICPTVSNVEVPFWPVLNFQTKIWI